MKRTWIDVGNTRIVDGLGAAQNAVADFHQRFTGDEFLGDLTAPRVGNWRLRHDMLSEEVWEFLVAATRKDIVGMADALADIIYVAIGGAVDMGIEIGAVFNEVHRSNMTKSSERNAEGKILKGPNYEPPDIAGCLDAQRDYYSDTFITASGDEVPFK